MAETTIRGIRVPDDRWKAAQDRAEREATSVSAAVNRFLERWGKGGVPR
jgi:hypothetical protein